MSVCATAKRRRTQARNGYRHLHKSQRPKYKVRDQATATRREQIMRERRARLIQAGVKV